jgi:hypothetical protein
MKRALLLMVVSALLVTLGFAQTPAAGSNTDPATVKGCLGGSDGNYTVVEDGSRQLFKITTSSVDLKAHVGHDVKLIGHNASGTVSSGAADNSFAVTELSMISEQCAAAAATVGAVVPYSQTVIEPTTATPASSASASTPAVEAAAPAATVSPSAAPASTPAVEAAAPATTVSSSATPAATVSPAAAQVSTPPVEATAPAATASPSAAVSAPTEKTDHSARRPAAPRKLSAKQATAAAAPAATVSPTTADAATASPSPATVSPAAADAATASPSATSVTPDAAATTPAVTHRTGSLSLLIAFVVLVIVLGTLAPLLGRWRKRKMLERTGTPNLSFTNAVITKEISADDAGSDQEKPEPLKVA